jgi:hypothetical protein
LIRSINERDKSFLQMPTIQTVGIFLCAPVFWIPVCLIGRESSIPILDIQVQEDLRLHF